MELKVGDVIACYSNRGLVSRLIGWWTDSIYSHTAIVYDVWDCGCIIIGEINGTYTYTVREIPYKESQYDVFRCVNEVDKQKVQHQIMRLGGSRYDWLDIFRLFLRLPRYKESPKQLICSEAIDVIYRNIGIDLELPNSPSPQEVIQSKKLYKVN